MKKRAFVLLTAVVSVAIFIRKLNKSLKLTLENRTAETLDLYIGTKAAPDAMAIGDFLPGETRALDLTNLPLLSHDAVYLRFPDCGDKAGYVRTLIYDIDERSDQMHAAIVDYGDHNFDIRIVK